MKPELAKTFLALGLAGLLYACGGGDGDDDSPPPPPPTVRYTVSGAIQSASNSAIDSDVNDPVAPYRANDTAADAQPVPNPVTLGGYLNRPGFGPEGRSRAAGDITDIYRVKLLNGQQITLLIAGDGVNEDLDLALADSGGNLLDASTGQGRVESLTVAAGGDYLIAVGAVRGASNYVLTIGQSPGTAGAGPRLRDAFVPGEAIVRFQEHATARTTGLLTQAEAMRLTARSRGETVERNRLVNLAELEQATPQAAWTAAEPSAVFGDLQPAAATAREKLKTLYLIKSLNLDPDVATAAPNHIRRPLLVPTDPLYSYQWHYPLINLPQAWDQSTGANVVVAVIDTGVALGHPDLQGQLTSGYDFIRSPANAGDGDGIDPDPNDPGDRSNPDGSSSFHGTHVAGTVAAVTGNDIGVAGVAFRAKVMPLRAVGRFGGSAYDIEQAVLFAAGLPNDSGTVPPRRADVINISLGGTGFSAADQAVYDQARAAGVVIVAAAGNDANSIPFFPAAYPGVIGVSAVDIAKSLAPYSSFGPWVSVAAPGGNTARDLNGDGKPDGVLSTVATDTGGTLVNDYVIWQGTSMATPHLAGVMALMKSVAPNLTPRELFTLLADGALTEDLGAPGKDDQYGYGLINAEKAVAAARGRPGDPAPILEVSPASLNFGSNLDSLNLVVANAGGGSLTVNPPSEDSGGWLSVTPARLNADGTGDYTVAVRRADLADGTYRATVTFSSSANSTQATVIMQVANDVTGTTVGQQYAVLADPDTGDTVASVAGQSQADGSHTFVLRDVPAGTYQLYAGSDSDNDQFICDEGESCGAYLTLEAPARIAVDRDVGGLNFVSGFTVKLTTTPSSGAGFPESGIPRGPAPSTGIRR